MNRNRKLGSLYRKNRQDYLNSIKKQNPYNAITKKSFIYDTSGSMGSMLK